MEVILGMAIMVFGLWMLWEFPGIIIPGIVVLILFKSCSSSVEVSVEDSTESGQEQVQDIEQPSETPIIEDSVTEKCISGQIVLLIIENGENFTHTKEDMFGYPVKCSE